MDGYIPEQPLAQNATVNLRLSRTVQIEPYQPFSMQLEISSDCGGGIQTKTHLDNVINDLSDYMMTKFEEELTRHVQAQKALSVGD